VGDILERELGWSPERRVLELGRFAEEADAEGIVADAAPAQSVHEPGPESGERRL
jgi:hypothetical protein